MFENCVSEKTYKRSVTVVTVISVIVGLIGFILAIFGVFQMGVVQKDEVIKSDFEVPGLDESGFGVGLLLLGIFAIILAVLGCLAAKKLTNCFTIPYIVLTFLVGLIILILALVVLGAGSKYVDKFQEKGCKKLTKKTEITEAYNNAISKWVCSDECPCWSGPDKSTEKLWRDYPD